jgi:hypothetical protein
LKDGVIKLAPYSDLIPADVRAVLDKAVEDVKSGAVQPYGGEIKDQSGALRVAKGGVLADADIRGTNWLVAGMLGQLKN